MIQSKSLSRIAAASLLCFGLGVAGPAVAKSTHPDLSGVWVTFQNDRTGGRFGAPAGPKLSKKGKEMVAAFKSKYDLTNLEPGAYCVPGGMPTEMFGLGAYPFEILQQPKRITMLVEIDNQFRSIFLDQKTFPKGYPHTRGGYSIGHWDGNTLVIETGLLRSWPIELWPHSDQARIVERISLKKKSDVKITTKGFLGGKISNTILVDEMTMTDPVMYDGPQKITLYARRLPQSEMVEYDCIEGNWMSAVEATAKKKDNN